MSPYNKLSDIQYVRFQILPVDLHFRMFWSAGIPNMLNKHLEELAAPPKCCWNCTFSFYFQMVELTRAKNRTRGISAPSKLQGFLMQFYRM